MVSDSPAAGIKLTGDVTIYQAADINAQLISAIRANGRIEVDLASVTELDTSGVQVMLVAQREAKALGHRLRWVAHSHAVLEVLRRLALESELGEEVSILGA